MKRESNPLEAEAAGFTAQPISLVVYSPITAPMELEPNISVLKGLRPYRLDDGAKNAGGEIRTHTDSRPRDFKSRAAALTPRPLI